MKMVKKKPTLNAFVPTTPQQGELKGLVNAIRGMRRSRICM